MGSHGFGQQVAFGRHATQRAPGYPSLRAPGTGAVDEVELPALLLALLAELCQSARMRSAAAPETDQGDYANTCCRSAGDIWYKSVGNSQDMYRPASRLPAGLPRDVRQRVPHTRRLRWRARAKLLAFVGETSTWSLAMSEWTNSCRDKTGCFVWLNRKRREVGGRS